jgi:putative transposase
LIAEPHLHLETVFARSGAHLSLTFCALRASRAMSSVVNPFVVRSSAASSTGWRLMMSDKSLATRPARASNASTSQPMTCAIALTLQALKARPRRRRLPPDLGERQAAAVAPNVLDRSFEAVAPNRKWIADFTYVWTAEGWLYVSAVIDLFSRRVVGWSMQTAMTAQLVTDALVMAIWRRGKPDALLHHSDRGSQYTSEQFQRLMIDHGVVCSMSRSGNVWDNAAMESFFSSLKTERTARKIYRTRDEAKADVFDYIERFYNPNRRHSTIGYLSPMEFERKAGLA